MYYLFIMRQVICWFVYIGKKPPAWLDTDSDRQQQLLSNGPPTAVAARMLA